MPLAPGAHLGPYEIIAALGAGGMGEVYRARDTRLQRDVALKVLPPALASDPERLARLEREAHLLAALNHPHIAAIYGFEHGALAMELVAGDTLKGPLPIREALPLAHQICEALEYAHERGIVHRDLKPANIKVTPEGQVKLLDFGLAKALAADTAIFDLNNSPTLTHAPTMPGVILGTAAYMAPEQAKGKPVDRRADIWAFGCVLFELLTGQQAFRGETVTDVLAALISQDPDWSLLPDAVPPSVRSLLARCLKKDPRQRLQAIGDARIALDEAEADAAAGAERPPHPAPRAGRSRALVVLSAFVVLLAIALTAVVRLRPTPPPVRSLRFSIEAPVAGSSFTYGLALSPDGTRLVYAASDASGAESLWLRPLDSLTATPLSGTADGQFPFWSPDGSAIGFFADGSLKRFDFSTHAVRSLCAISSAGARGGSWSSTGVIVFAPDVSGPLMKVSTDGGTPTPATTPGLRQGSQRWPYFLPDGRHFLLDAEGYSGPSSIALGSLDSSATRNLVAMPSADSRAIYSNGYILYASANALVAQKFDLKSLRTTAAPVPIAEGIAPVDVNGPTGYLALTASSSGLLSYLRSSAANSQLQLVDRSGKLLRTLGSTGRYESTALSPDGKRLAISLANPATPGASDLWLIDLARADRTRFTFDNANNNDPVWSPDGRWIYFGSNLHGSYAIYRRPADGSQPPTLVFSSGSIDAPDTFTPGGRGLLVDVTGGNSLGTQILWVPIGPEPAAQLGKPTLYPTASTRALNASLSPDGRWVVYESNAAGGSAMDIFAADFPHHSGQWQLSYHGGFWPYWSPDGHQIYFVSAGHLMVVTVTMGAVPSFSAPRALFAFTPAGDATESKADYAVLPGGRQFILDQLTSTNDSPITVLTHWTASLPH